MISQGNFETEFIRKIEKEVNREYGLTTYHEESYIEMGEFYDPMRRQYDGNKLLKEIDSVKTPPAFIKIGLFRVDIFIPILTYIFGQATYMGNAGIASIYRLRNEHYGMKKDEELLLDRFIKVIIHELGHSFGSIHCHLPTCVMRSSTYVEDIDLKSMHLCPKCKQGLTY